MKSLLALLPPLLLVLPGCAAQVTHATKTDAEMRADIQSCTDQADAEHGFDAIATLRATYACLDARGYQRGRAGLAAGVDGAKPTRRAEQARSPGEPVGPCQIPCTKRNPG